jgi:hypothetical protein
MERSAADRRIERRRCARVGAFDERVARRNLRSSDTNNYGRHDLLLTRSSARVGAVEMRRDQ